MDSGRNQRGARRRDRGRARYQVAEPHYNLIERRQYEGEPEDVCVAHGLGVNARMGTLSRYVNPAGLKLLDSLDIVATRHGATPAQVTLAQLMARPSVTAPICSATSTQQLADILKSVDLQLVPEDFAVLDPLPQGPALT
jgi:aryl-alcohol dehydrogenase-like predicted oxidoreductase